MGNDISLDPLIERALNGVQYVGQHLGGELVGRHITYVYYLQHNLDSLENSLGDLQALRAQLTRRIRLQLGYGKQTDEKVDWWIERVDRELAIGDQLKEECERHVDSLCLAGICSTHYFSTSAFREQVEKCVKELISLKSKGDGFTDEVLVVNAAAELDQGAKMPCDSVGLKAKLAEVLKFLDDESAGIVGVYGQGGVGKLSSGLDSGGVEK